MRDSSVQRILVGPGLAMVEINAASESGRSARRSALTSVAAHTQTITATVAPSAGHKIAHVGEPSRATDSERLVVLRPNAGQHLVVHRRKRRASSVSSTMDAADPNRRPSRSGADPRRGRDTCRTSAGAPRAATCSDIGSSPSTNASSMSRASSQPRYGIMLVAPAARRAAPAARE